MRGTDAGWTAVMEGAEAHHNVMGDLWAERKLGWHRFADLANKGWLVLPESVKRQGDEPVTAWNEFVYNRLAGTPYVKERRDDDVPGLCDLRELTVNSFEASALAIESLLAEWGVTDTTSTVGADGAAVDARQAPGATGENGRCGIEYPRFLWWQGKRYEIDVEGKPWDLFVYLWGKASVAIPDIAHGVWNKRRMRYASMKTCVTRLNQAIARARLPFTWTKNRRENALVYNGPTIPSSVSR
jgi:hypothetical protein